jgi:hypothetical protein
MDAIQHALNSVNQTQGTGEISIEYIGQEEPEMQPTQQIPNDTGIPDNAEIDAENDGNDSLEEAYSKILTGASKSEVYTISIPNVFADNIKTYLAQEGVSNIATVDGNKTYIDIVTTSDAQTIEEALRQHVMGDLTYLKIYKSDQQLSESK